MQTNQKIEGGDFFLTSSIKEEIWHPKTNPKAFEWWYFDALSDDGTEAVVIVFFDNFIFSPRYNHLTKQTSLPEKAFRFFDSSIIEDESISENKRVPAVAFVYYKNGKPYYRAYNEFSPEDFSSNTDNPNCTIGKNFFKFEQAPYGAGYTVSINANLPKHLKLEAHFEWLSVESNLLADNFSRTEKSHFWNLVAPRSDVTGRITVAENTGKNRDVIHFRGSGYHDHSLDNRLLPDFADYKHKGRAHFADATAIFCRYAECGENTTKLCIVRDGELNIFDATCREENFLRDRFGIKYPSLIFLEAEDKIKLTLKQSQIIDSNFFYLRFLSEAEFTEKGFAPHKTICITEHIEPKMLKYRRLNYLFDMRIGRNGKPAFFP